MEGGGWNREGMEGEGGWWRCEVDSEGMDGEDMAEDGKWMGVVECEGMDREDMGEDGKWMSVTG